MRMSLTRRSADLICKSCIADGELGAFQVHRPVDLAVTYERRFVAEAFASTLRRGSASIGSEGADAARARRFVCHLCAAWLRLAGRRGSGYSAYGKPTECEWRFGGNVPSQPLKKIGDLN